MNDPFATDDPERLAVFVQEYVRRDGQPDAGVVAVIGSQLRDPRWLPHQIAERLLAKPEIQAAIKAARAFYRPADVKEVSAATITTDMEDIYQKAMDDRQYPAAISAKKMQAELHGLLVKTIDVNVRHTAATMTDAQLEDIARRGIIDGEFKEVSNLPAVISNV